MPRLPEDFIRSVKDNNDIISVAGSYVQLKRSGNTHSCCCPFHSEKTPSCHFYSTPDPHFYCFGCHVGGDVITFIMMIERLEYIDAIRFLADRAGMAFPEDNYGERKTVDRLRMLNMNKEAGSFFHKQLFTEEGKVGLDYLTNRGLTIHTIRKFGLGYAANDWHRLHMYMRDKGYTDFELAEASLLATNNNKFYDKFRNRVMFPIFDTRGSVVGFGGRTLGDDKAKYLNSGETPVFHKGNMLYAYNIAKFSQKDSFILCEGYMDVIAMHQAGYDNAVASLGTALTDSHARMLNLKGKKEIILSYDADAAGQNATMRAVDLLANVGLQTRVLKIDGNVKDPDEYIKNYGGEQFGNILEKSSSAIDFQLDKLAEGLDLNTGDGKAQYLRKTVMFLAEISNKIVRDVYISKVSKQTEIPQQSIESSVDRQMNINKNKAKKDEQRAFIQPQRDIINPDAMKLPLEEKAERGIICFLYHNPEMLPKVREKLEGGFVTAFNKRVYEFLSEACENGSQPEVYAFNEVFNGQEMGRIREIIADKVYANNKEAVMVDLINVLNDHKRHAEDKRAEDMTDDDLLAFTESEKRRRKNE